MGFVRVQVQDHLQGLDSNSNSAQIEAEDVPAPSPPPPPPLQPPQPNSEPTEIPPHRNTYFYLLRPRTATKHPVLIPLAPNITLSAALAGRTVLEFPTIYVLGDSPRTLLTEKEKKTDRFLLEEEYLRTKPEQADVDGDGDGDMRMENTVPDTLDTGQVDEQRVLEVLKKDLFGAGSTQSA